MKGQQVGIFCILKSKEFDMAKKFRGRLAFTAGVIGGVAMVILLAIFRGFGFTDIDLSTTLGSMITSTTGSGTRLIGFVMHLVSSGCIAILYAFIFDTLDAASWLRGLIIAVPHALIGGIFTLILPVIHPAIPEVPGLPEPGFMYANFGAGDVFIYLLIHLVYGAIVGGLYKVRVISTSGGNRP
jgi:hypothetical protein